MIVIEYLFLAVVALSLSGSLVALLLLLVKRIGGQRFSQTWHYYIWLVVVARLLIPFSLEINLVNAALHKLAPQVVVDSTGHPSDAPSSFAPAPIDGQDFPASATQADLDDERLAALGGLPWQELVRYASYLWAVVAAGLFVRKATSYIGLIHEIRKNSSFGGDPEAAAHRDRLCKAMKISPAPVLYVSDKVPAPMLIGIVRQQIILPTDPIGQPDLKHVLHHELVHYRRYDILYKWLAQIAVCVHWFNPLVYLMRREISRSCELSCDESVIRRANEQERKDYGEAIISAIKPGKALAHTGISVSMSENTKDIKERLDAIMRFKSSSRLVICLSAIMAVTLMCGATFAGAYKPDAATATPVPTAPANGGDLNGLQTTTAYKGRTESLIENFSPYAPFGVVYDPDKDIVSYNGERVKLFVVFSPHKEGGMIYAFELNYHDQSTTSTIYLEGVRDNTGAVTAVRPLNDDVALDILSALGGLRASQNNNDSATASQSSSTTQVSTMDGTVILESSGIRGSDIPISDAPSTVTDWINTCNSTGAYMLKTNVNGVYTTYIYYNGDGRYPWDMKVDNGRIIIDLFSNSSLKTSDGYYLMYFTAPQDYSQISLYLDGLAIAINGTN